MFGTVLFVKKEVFEMVVVLAALRIPSGETEFTGFLVQVLVVGGIVSLLLLLAGVVFWRARRAGHDHPK